MKNVSLFAASNNPESINGSEMQIKEKNFSDNLKKSVDQLEN